MIRTPQLVYRAPYVYLCQSSERSRLIRIGQTMRPGYEQLRLEKRYQHSLLWLAHVRAFAVLAPVLWARFSYCSAGRQWFHPDRRLLVLLHQLEHRDSEALLTVDDLQSIFAAVFPEAPYIGIAQYRVAETYIRHSRHVPIGLGQVGK